MPTSGEEEEITISCVPERQRLGSGPDRRRVRTTRRRSVSHAPSVRSVMHSSIAATPLPTGWVSATPLEMVMVRLEISAAAGKANSAAKRGRLLSVPDMSSLVFPP